MGSLRQRTPGSWQLLFYVDGKQKSKTVHGTKREASALLLEIDRSISQGTYEAKPRKSLTVGDQLREWLEDVKPRVEATTYDRYECAVRTRLLPEFGGFALTALGPREIKSVYASWEKSGLSPNTIGLYHVALCSALDLALRLEMIHRNPASLVPPPPRVSRSVKTSLDEDQVGVLLEAAKGSPWRVYVILALTTGMRIGEICGLRWENVDLEAGTIFVRKSIARLNGGDRVEKGPKTRSSVRPISLPLLAVSELGGLPRDADFVFHRKGKPVCPRNAAQGITRLCKKLGLPVTTHGLRHTHATMLLNLNVHPKVVAERLGHNDIQETLGTYSHVLPSQQREAADKIGRLMTR